MFETKTKSPLSQLNELNAMDAFTFEYDEKSFQLFTDKELIAAVGLTLVFDVESYVNYFLVAFKSVETKRVIYFEDSPNSQIDTLKLGWILKNFCIVGFNSNTYDILVTYFALQGWHCADLKDLTNEIILQNSYPKEIEQKYKIKIPRYNHIDLIEVAPLMASLKIYGGRLHTVRMQELPLPHDAVLTELQSKAVRLYCINDLDTTIDLLTNLKEQIELRTQLSIQYNQDLRSKSDAQLAEAIIGAELKRLNGYYPKRAEIKAGTKFRYQVPSFIRYETPVLQRVLDIVRNADFIVDATGSVAMPKELDIGFQIGESIYKMGIGGLHSSEKCISHKSDENTLLIDKDVASYYPSIILNLGLCPKHLGKSFLTVYRSIVDRRLEAKRTKNKVVNESLKITINGSFGKLGNKYSVLYAPDLLIQVTLTGQLSLLLLIEMLEKIGIPVISANTDGIIIKCPKERYIYAESIVVHWQNLTGFITEEARYKAVYNRDVNNYIAIKEDGTVKVKGTYAERGSSGNSVLSKNPESLICNDAVIAFLTVGTPIEQTVRECKDIRRFVTIRNVKGGAEKSGVYLGRAIRWYYSKTIKGTINYVLNGNKVPNSDNAMPIMDLPSELPLDIDHDYYIQKAKEILKEIGYYAKHNETAYLF